MQTADRRHVMRILLYVRPYLLVVASVVLSTLLRHALNPLLGNRVAFITYFPALVFSAWVGGWGGGCLALVLSTVAATYYFIMPTHEMYVVDRTDQVSLLVFAMVGLATSAISNSQRITRRQAEEAAANAERNAAELRESEARKSAVLEVALDCIIAIDEDGRITEFNPAAQSTFGYAAEEALGQLIAETVIPPGLRQKHQEGFAHYLATGVGPVLGHRIELTGMRKDGQEFPVELAIVPMKGYGTKGFTAYLRDISERKALDREREALAQREHRIAEQLQQALQPAVPSAVPGLELADYYHPALEEAGVGGDFTDVFAADKGVTYLVVGDLSGKGLEAASQVAMVRNMLRFALYNGQTLAATVSTLSRTLVENDLLTGFATLFVGRFDAHTRVLNYVNCGQDAGLIRRAATGNVEDLPSTGSVLGGFAEAVFEERATVLETGDILALFTDGLTEAGPTRTALLTGNGVAALLREQQDVESARAVVSRLIAGVDAYARDGMRDDVCLLVAVAGHGSTM